MATNLMLAPVLGVLAVPAAHAQLAAALTFNGSNYVQVPNNATLSVPTNLTLEAWMKPTSVSGFRDIVGKTGYELGVQQAGTGFQVQFQLRVAGGWYTATTPAASPLTLGRWYHVAGTFDGNAMRLWVDGTLRDTQNVAGSIDTTTAPLRIATVDATTDNFIGTIDEVRISKVLRYAATFTPSSSEFAPDANTVGLWHLDEGSGATTADASVNGNTGSLVNTPIWTADTPFVTGDTTPPSISGITVSNVLASGATIAWNTDELATSQVDFGPTSDYGTSSTFDQSLVASHVVTLAALTGNTTYHYRVVSTDLAGNPAQSADQTFMTGTPNANSVNVGEWAPAASWPLVDVHSVVMNTGEILMWDAWETGGTQSVRIWNPSTQAFTPEPNLTSQIFCSGHVVLSDGRILVVGGHNGGEVGINEANIFDPRDRSWTRATNMKYARWYPGATELADGRVLAFSGNSVPGSWSNTPEVYNPIANTWTSLAVNTSDVKEGEYPLNFLLPTGKLFVIAPSTGLTRLLDVAGQTWGSAGLTTAPLLNGSAAMYRPGKILYSGGGPLGGSSVTTTAVVDMNAPAPAWRTTASMAYPRYEHNLTVLPTGEVLAVGGTPDVDQTSHNGSLAAELWDPTTESWSTMASERDVRQYHSTSVLLPDGRILSAGGGRWSTANDYLTSEIYSPPYLFKGPRPTVSAAPSSATYATTMTVTSPDAASIASVALTDMGANTHTSDMDSRYVDLSFTAGSGVLNVETPANADIAPPGFYMLWAVNTQGVPSFARIVQITAPSQSDTQPPTVSLTAPAAGSTVTGSGVSLTADASDNVGVTGVQFLLDGAPIGSSVTSAPYTLNWDSTTAANGTHTLAARASDAAGNATTSAAVSVTVSNVDTTPPVISTVAAGSISATGASITWSTNEASDSQVDYGTTASYGSSTTLNTALVTSHSVALSGLQASTLYHYRVKSKDASGNLATSADATFTTTSAGPPVLVGDKSIESTQDSDNAGTAEAFQYTATTTGSVANLNLYLDTANASTQVLVGIYADASSKPGTLLAQATIATPKNAAWNTIPIAGPSLTAGQKYWIVALSPSGKGTLYVRDKASGSTSQTSSQTNLAALPSTWTSGQSWSNSSMSAYVTGSTGPDTTPPTIVGPTASNVTPTGAIVTWTTDEPSTSQVNFGTTTALGSNTAPDATLVTSHSQTLTGLTPSTIYYCQVVSKDASGNQANSSTITFTTPATPDTTPPVITNVRAFGSTSASISIGWTTDELSDSQVEYGPTSAYGSSTPLATAGVTNHVVTLSGVPAETTYHYRVKSKDPSGNLAVSPDDIASTDAPAANPIAVTIQKSVGWTSPTINVGDTVEWLNDDPTGQSHTATSDTGLFNSGVLNTNDTFTWQFNAAGQYAYHCVIHGSAGVITVVDTTPPTISSVAATGISSSGATINWTTNEAADTQVEYGLSTSYGSSTTLNTSLVTSHSVALTGLVATTPYHYRVKSKDASGNLATSADATFTTTAAAPPTLLGDSKIESPKDSNPAGSAEAFQYTAVTTGTATKINVYLDSTNAATQLVVGLYTSSGSNPGTLLAQATIAMPVKGAWNSVSIPGVPITSGTKYWIAVLAPPGAGTIQIRDKSTGSLSQSSSQSNLTSLPATWTSGQSWGSSSMSAYVQ